MCGLTCSLRMEKMDNSYIIDSAVDGDETIFHFKLFTITSLYEYERLELVLESFMRKCYYENVRICNLSKVGHIEFTVKCFSKFISSCYRTWFIKRLPMKLPVLPKQSWFGVISSVIKSQLFTGERGNFSFGGTEEIRSLTLFNMHRFLRFQQADSFSIIF